MVFAMCIAQLNYMTFFVSVRLFDDVILTHTSCPSRGLQACLTNVHTHILRMPQGQPVGREDVGRSHVETLQMWLHKPWSAYRSSLTITKEFIHTSHSC